MNKSPGQAPTEESESHPARALTTHLLRMFETRMEAAGIALQSEVHSFSARLQLRVLAAAAVFVAIWGGIVLLAIALPPHLRVPVLSAVVAGFVVVALVAYFAARKFNRTREIGSLSWFLEELRLDLEVFSRALSRGSQPERAPEAPSPQAAAHGETPSDPSRSPPNDLAA